MPSEPRRFRLRWLRSQGLGVACGLSTVALLAVGSFVMAATREGASRGIELDDVRPFFAAPSWVHLWFYLLVGVVALYALNTVLATWHSVARKIRGGVRAPAAYAPAFMHLAFLAALLAHAVGGLLGGDRGQVVLAGAWQPLADGREARLAALDVETLPSGMPKEVRARVELRDAAGQGSTAILGYNAPLSSGLGSNLYLLADMGELGVAELEVGAGRCVVREGEPCLVAGARVDLLALDPSGADGEAPTARILVRRSGPAPEERLLPLAVGSRLADGTWVRLAAIRTEPAVLLRARHAPGDPWALAAAVLMTAALAMMWKRFVPAAKRPYVPGVEEDETEAEDEDLRRAARGPAGAERAGGDLEGADAR